MVINIKLLISIINQIIIILDKNNGTMADKYMIGITHEFRNKVIINLLA